MKNILRIALKNLRLHWNRHLLTAIGLIMGMMGMILFGGYVLRMEGYLAAQSIFLRQVGHLSLLKKDSHINFNQSPNRYSFDSKDQLAIINLLSHSADLIGIKRMIPVAATPAMLTNGCQNFPIWIQGVNPSDMQWIYEHPEVKKKVPELTHMESGIGYWTSSDSFASNIAPALWKFLDKKPSHCGTSEENNRAQQKNEMQVYTQDFFGGLGLADSTIVGLKYSGFSLLDEVYFLASMEWVKNLIKSENLYKWAIYFEDSSHLSSKSSIINNLLKEASITDFELIPYTSAKVSEIYYGSMVFVLIMFLFFVILICGVVILTVFNSLQIAFLERKKDISIYKSIGFRHSIIIQIFQYEYLFISLISSLIASIWSQGLAEWNNSMNFRFQLPGYSSTLQFRLEPSMEYIFFVTIFIIVLIQIVCFFQLRKMLMKSSLDLIRFNS